MSEFGIHSMTDLHSLMSVDEVGNETALLGDVVLKSAFRPIYQRERDMLVVVGVSASIRPMHDGAPISVDRFISDAGDVDRNIADRLCHALHIRNHAALAVQDLPLLLELSECGGDPGSMALSLTSELNQRDIEAGGIFCRLSGSAARLTADEVDRLRQAGIRIALGDFGPDGGSIETLRVLSPDIVHIDGAWFRRVCRAPAALRLASSLFARLAEGGCVVMVGDITSVRELDAALDAGAGLVQGDALAPAAIAGTAQSLDPLDFADIRAADSLSWRHAAVR